MPRCAPFPFDPAKFDCTHQVGGIQTALIDHPTPGGRAGEGGRLALVNTGSPLRFTVALDRGGDIVEAFYAAHSLAYLTANGYKPASPAYHSGMDWLMGWPGGLVTTCGPQYIGAAREEDGWKLGLHGHHSNTPAAVEAILNPDPAGGIADMRIVLQITDSRMFGPVVSVRRVIACRLGVPEIRIEDEVTNRGNQPAAHNWLYHINLGYPLLDQGARLVFRGRLWETWGRGNHIDDHPTPRKLDLAKNVPGPIPEHTGPGECGMLLDPAAERDGLCHVGMVNRRLGLGLEIIFHPRQLPRLANWQHFGPRGSYVSGIEPFSGSLFGKARDKHRLTGQMIEPGETRRYQVTLRVLTTPDELTALARRDGKVL